MSDMLQTEKELIEQFETISFDDNNNNDGNNDDNNDHNDDNIDPFFQILLKITL